MELTQPAEQVCPHLRSSIDPKTAFRFPSHHNECYAAPHPTRITLEHQQYFCLHQRHIECPVYRRRDLATYTREIDFITNLHGVEPVKPLPDWITFAPSRRYQLLLWLLIGVLGLAIGLLMLSMLSA